MSTLLHFLENARFPSPPVVTTPRASTTDISLVDIALVDDAWKAKHAIRDNALIQNLCDVLAQVLGDTPLIAGALDECFSPRLGRTYQWKAPNNSEAKSVQLLTLGVNNTLAHCMLIIHPELATRCEPQAREGISLCRVHAGIYVDTQEAIVNAKARVLQEAKSPTVMEYLRHRLPHTGAILRWTPGGSVLAKLFLEAAVYLGLRQLEWLFLTCHNSWVVFRLTKVGDERVLAYSPMIDISDSSIPFRAYLGATLSVIRNIPVMPTALPVNDIVDTLPEDERDEEEDAEPSNDDSDNESGSYTLSANETGSPQSTTGSQSVSSVDTFMLTASPASSSCPYWVHLRSRPIAPSFPPEWGRRLRIWELLGEGSTGAVYGVRMGDTSLALKLLEMLHPSDLGKRRRLRSEFRIYQHLEEAYSSRTLHERIAPQCYGILGNRRICALIMDMHFNTVAEWGDLSSLERQQIFNLVKQLHSAAVVHGDIEPRNVVRTASQDFLLIDFSESTLHHCPDTDQFDALVLDGRRGDRKPQCPELMVVQHELSRPRRQRKN